MPERRMRIVQLGPVPPPHGGVSMNLLAIHRKLIELGHGSTIIDVTDRTGTTNDPHVVKPRSSFGLVKLLLSTKCDVVHYHLGGDFTLKLAGLTFLCGILPGKRSVLTFHSGGYARNTAGTAKRNSVRALALRSLDLVIGVNEQMTEMFSAFGVHEERSRLIPPYELNGPDPSVSLPSKLSEMIEGFDPFLLSVGALEREYGNEFLINAMPQVLERYPYAGLVIIGDGTQREVLAEAINRNGLNDRVDLAGDLDHSIVLHLIDRASALLRLTDYDGDSIAVREALFLGTPVVASDNGMRPQGVLTIRAPFDYESLVEAVAKRIGAQFSVRPEVHGEGGNAAKAVEAYLELLSK